VLVYFQKLKEEYKPALTVLQQDSSIGDTQEASR
jgi:hypothetical protein